MTISDTYSRLQRICRTALAIPVIADYPDAERPVGPYAMLSLTSETVSPNALDREFLANPDYVSADAEPYQDPWIMRTWFEVRRVWSLNIYATNALDYASRAQFALRHQYNFGILDPYRVNEIGGIVRLPEYIGNVWEDRVNVDVTIVGYEPFDMYMTDIEHVDVEWIPNYRRDDPTFPVFTLHVDKPGSIPLELKGFLDASSEIIAGLTVLDAVQLQASLIADSDMAGLVTQDVTMQADLSSTSAISAGLSQALSLSAGISAISSVSASLEQSAGLAASLSAQTALNANLAQHNSLISALPATSSIAALLTRANSLASTLAATSTITGEITQASAYDPDAEAYWSRSATEPTEAQKQWYSDFVTTLKAQGIWDTRDVIQLYFAHAEDLAVLNMKGTSFTATRYGTTTWTAGVGIVTTGTSGSYIDTGWNGVSGAHYSQNDASVGVWAKAGPASGASSLVGNAEGSPTRYIAWASGGTVSTRLNGSTSNVNFSGARTGFYQFRRVDANTLNFQTDLTEVLTNTSASTTPGTTNTTLARQGTGYSAYTLALLYGGSALTDAQQIAMYNAATVPFPT